MKFASVRDLRINASKIMKEANKEEIVVTKRGHPFALLIPISEEDLDRVRKAVKAAKLRSALEELWEESMKKGTDAITMEEVDAEVKKYRKEKHSKSCY